MIRSQFIRLQTAATTITMTVTMTIRSFSRVTSTTKLVWQILTIPPNAITFSLPKVRIGRVRPLSSTALPIGDQLVKERYQVKAILQHPLRLTTTQQQQEQALESMTFWASQGTEEGTELTWRLLDLLIHHNVVITPEILHHVIQGWARQPAKLSLQGVLARLEDYASSVQPNLHTYDLLLEVAMHPTTTNCDPLPMVVNSILATVDDGVPHAAEIATRIKRKIQKLHLDNGSHFPKKDENMVVKHTTLNELSKPSLQPLLVSPLDVEKELLTLCKENEATTREYNKVLQSWINSNQNPDHIATQCVDVLRHMKGLYHQGNTKVMPTQVTYSILMTALARAGRAEEAETTLSELLNTFNKWGNKAQQPNKFHFTAVIDAWAKSQSQDAPERAWNILLKMQRMARETNNYDLIPTTITYNTVLNAMAQTSAQEPKAGLAALALLKDMWTWYEEGNVHAKPNLVTYNTVLNTFAEYRGNGAAEQADQILIMMHTRYREGDQDLKPDLACYNTVLKAWRNSGTSIAPERASALLDEMERLATFESFDTVPDRISYITAINAWSRSGRKGGLQHIMTLLEKGSNVGVSCEIGLFNAFLDGLAKCGYSQEAQDVLDELCNNYIQGKSKIKPDVVTFNTVIAAWRPALKAEGVFRQLMELGPKLFVTPTVISFTTLITTFAKNRNPEKAEAYLQELQTMYASTNDQSLRPDKKLYTTVLQAWKLSGDSRALHKCYALLHALKALQNAGVPNCGPDHFVYNTILEVITASKTQDKAEQAQEILDEMKFQNIKFNKFTLQCVLLACARVASDQNATTSSKERTFIIAHQTFNLLLEDFQPEPRDFRLFFAAASGLEDYAAKEVEEAKIICQKFGFERAVLGGNI